MPPAEEVRLGRHGHDQDHDLLSFTSVFIREFSSYSLGYTLLGILLQRKGPGLRPPIGGGSFFQVSVVKANELLEARFLPLNAPTPYFPEVVALKIPVITDGLDSPRSRKLWSSMAKELQILKSELLASHRNIVRLLGVCWSTVEPLGGSVMPVLTLEVAELGDLQSLFNRGSQMTLRKILGLCIDVAAGVRALHEVGIIHCDLKPENILLFKDEKLTMVAKLADFGSSVLMSNVQEAIQLEAGTQFWQAPECDQPIKKEELLGVDIFPLGLIVLNFITADGIIKLFKSIDSGDVEIPESVEELKRSYRLAGLVASAVRAYWLPDKSNSHLGMSGALLASETLTKASERTKDAETVLTTLRLMLYQVIRRELLSSEFAENRNLDLNPQEADIFLHHSLEEPTPYDLERIWNFAKSLRDIEPIQDSTFTPGGSIPEQADPSDVLLTLERWSFGTLRIVPGPVVRQLEDQLEAVALNKEMHNARRREAAFQYAVMTLSRLQLCQTSDERIQKSLDLLLLAAKLHHKDSKGIVGWLFDAFGKQLSPEDTVREEDDWLPQAMLDGSETARRRLSTLDESGYLSRLIELRTECGGIGLDLPSSWIIPSVQHFYETLREFSQYSNNLNSVMSYLFIFATTGRYDLMRELTEEPNVDVNWTTDKWKESALLMACRSGHRSVAQLLLERGADPTIASQEGVTPLHFLSSFDDGDIPEIARLLIENKALLEARSSSAATYHTVIDSTYGQINGTPLAWAVAANNVVAAKTLVNLGADPFDEEAKSYPVDDKWTTFAHTSPVLYASIKHQYKLLDELLPLEHSGVPDTSYTGTRWKLNNCLRKLGTLGEVDHSTPLAYCVRYSNEGFLHRLLLHGKDHELAFKKTFELLVERGSDPFDVDGKKNSALWMAVEFGQPFVFKYLMEWGDGCLRPSAMEWLQNIGRTVTLEDSIMFDTLMRYQCISDISIADWTRYFGSMSDLTNNVKYLEPFKQQLDPHHDFTDHLGRALSRGHSETARWFYEHANCGLTRVDNGDDFSVLGRLLMASKHDVNRAAAVQEFLELPNLPEEAFEDAMRFGESKLTALHGAAIFAEYRLGLVMAGSVFQMVLDKFHEPHHLNFQVTAGGYAGYAPLHVAVEAGNVEAVRSLLEEEDLDVKILTAKDESAVDLLFKRFKNQKQDLHFWEVPEENQTAEDMKHWERTLELYGLLASAGAKGHKFLAAVVRPEPDDIFYIASDTDSPVIKLPCGLIQYVALATDSRG
ncbi:hypothetical protein GP486_000618 [Trichoglossum hirsutum]|uniref:Protein kinase domain-containing protein n=1 Tax=Trichoglossum hirsutum TaxID=265104 RepID=A0A9P8LIF9_9PEZI|nr:hypothetical protein GP486_000618 [Trichoglossum hirsutum]